jgi:hypothetical protein
MCALSQIYRFNCPRFWYRPGNEHVQRNIGFKAFRLVYITPCNHAPVGRWDNLLYGTSRKSRVHFFMPLGTAFTFLNTLQSHPAPVVLYVILYAKSTIPDAQHDLEGILRFAHGAAPLWASNGCYSKFQNFVLVTTKLRQ